MLGAIIGDIVGSRFEFNNHRNTNFNLFTAESRFTDDTVCTVAVADCVLNINRWEPSDRDNFAHLLQGWCRRYPDGNYGLGFRKWINIPVPYNSFGNGAAMRISPVGYFFAPSDELVCASDFVTSVSHDHPEGLKGARAIAEAGSMAWRGATKAQIRAFVSGLGYDLDFTCDSIRASNWFDETCQKTVPQAVVCFLESEDFESAIRLAVSIGGDSDTIAAIAGGLAEAFYQEIPEAMVSEARARLPLEMLAVVDKFYLKNPK
jgi:ADP-ribosylglycohydrolase